MTELEIETIVGVKRRLGEHWGRAVSAEQTVYILHSRSCLKNEPDLCQCLYSLALDQGIDSSQWVQDEPVRLTVSKAGGCWNLHPHPSRK